MKQQYTELAIGADAAEQEKLIALLTDLNPTGFEEKDNELLVYFESGIDLKQMDSILEGKPYRLSTLEEKNWNEEWERNFSPVVVEEFCAIRASFHPPQQNVQHEIVITPKMSFGTGHHATTYMMVQQMQHLDFAGKTVFDFGTGTGILAILAEKLGAKDVVAIDTDPWSIENATENAQNNNCSHIHLTETSILPHRVFDIVLANINRNVLLQYAGELKSIIANDGYILLSGLLQEDEEVIVSSFSDACRLINKEEKSNWISLLFQNNQ